MTDQIDQEAPVGDTLHVKANANVTLGGVFVGYGEEGDIPDGVETRSAATLGLIDILDDPHAPAPADDESAPDGGEDTPSAETADETDGGEKPEAEPPAEEQPAHAQHATKKAAKRTKG